jgi:cytochrome c oxidase cbb3-type subunit 4
VSIENLRIAVTVLSFACFAGLVAWAWSARNRRGFDEAAHLPFADAGDGQGAADTHRSDAP